MCKSLRLGYNEVCDVRPAEAELLQTANAFSIGGLCRWCRSQILCHWYNLSLASGTEPEMHYIYLSASFCILHSMPVSLTFGTCATPQMFCYGCHCFCVRTRQRIRHTNGASMGILDCLLEVIVVSGSLPRIAGRICFKNLHYSALY